MTVVSPATPLHLTSVLRRRSEKKWRGLLHRSCAKSTRTRRTVTRSALCARSCVSEVCSALCGPQSAEQTSETQLLAHSADLVTVRLVLVDFAQERCNSPRHFFSDRRRRTDVR